TVKLNSICKNRRVLKTIDFVQIMLKIAFIGAGSLVFGETILTDILTFPALRNAVLCLEDIDPKRLDYMDQYLQKYRENHIDILEGVTIEKTTDQKQAIENAKYVINAVQIGGLEAVKHDLEIPLKYGVTQCVGDTLGPGGVFRFLRTITFYKNLLEQMNEYGYNTGDKKGFQPLLLNYTNPMAMNTWYCNELFPDSTLGLCHGVYDTAAVLRANLYYIGANPEEFDYLCAGINHMAWFLKIWYREPNAEWQDAYPLIREASKSAPFLTDTEKLRVDMMKATGFFMTESSGHLSEYLPYYRKRQDLLDKYRGESYFAELDHALDYNENIKIQKNLDKDFSEKLNVDRIPFKETDSGEYASQIINTIETNTLTRINGNVINKEAGLITNLPKNCCVEVPVFVDSMGIHPQGGITLPTICQALCMSNIMVQKAAVEGALTFDREKIYHAVLLDPNTASVCSPVEVRNMVDEMFEAESIWLPQFN
ncbi:MAG: family 4 glycosyl hydrolase, partial [Candidatus Hodarchaeales archaeon]